MKKNKIMERFLKYITIIVLVMFTLNVNVYAQTDTEFWFVNPEISNNHGDDPVIFMFTTREFAAEVTISMPAEPAFNDTIIYIPAYTTDSMQLVQADPRFALVENTTVVDQYNTLPAASRNNIGNKAVLITSTAPINVYFTQDRTNNSDIYALKGGNGIGTEFIIPFQEHAYNQADSYVDRAFSSIEIISFEDGTQVEITPPAGKDVYRSGSFPNQTNPFTVTLNRGQVYTLPPGWDPTVVRPWPNSGWWKVEGFQHIGGVIVKVLSGPGVAVVKKDDSARKGLDSAEEWGGWDIIADQWVPYKGMVGADNDILGTEYVAMRGDLLDDWEYVYCAAPEDNTRIWWGDVDTTAVGNTVPDAIIDRGEQVGIPFNSGVFDFNFMEIISNKPLSVLHVSGWESEMGGAVLPPISKCTGSTSVTIARSVNWPVYLNIMVRKDAQDDFLFEGVVQDGVGTLIDPADFEEVGSTGDWMAAQYVVPENDFSDFPLGIARTITNTKDVFHLGVIHGGGPGCRFGYFSDFNELKVSANTIQGDGIQPSSTIRACKGDTVQLYASGGSVFSWWPATNLSSTTISNPKAVVDGARTYYVEVSGACNNKDTATVNVEMAEQPNATFFVEKGQGCAPLNLEIRNLSSDVNQIYWDFNTTGVAGIIDRDTTKYHPSVITDVDSVFTHTFYNTSFEPIDSPQVFNVRLKVKATKCTDTVNTQITVYPQVTADFTLSNLDDTISCNPAVVDFEAIDSSINEDYYKWNFGDGSLSAAGDTTHEYINLNPERDTTYTARLVVRSDWYCRDTAYQDFLVHPYLEGGFTIDKDEGCSPFSVLIENLSSGADSIFMDYGDGEIDTLLSFSAINHLYRNDDGVDEVDTNIIVMRVKNDEGCEFTDIDTILVYPEFVATYTIDGNDYTGCNSRTVTFTNTTNDGTHLASRYLWEFADGTSMDTTNNTINKFYNNTTTADKTYNFRMTARSVYGCTDDTTNSIDIYRAYANFTVGNNEGCSPINVAVTNASIGDDITTWDWDYGDGHTDGAEDPFPYTYTNKTDASITYPLVLQVTGTVGCSTSKTIDITVYPEVKATYTIAETSVASCDSLVVDFNSSTIHSGLDGSVDYIWDFGDGASSSDHDPQHVYKNLTNAAHVDMKVDLHVETPLGCYYDTSSFIRVYPLVNADISIDQSSGCSPFTLDAVATEYIGIPAANYQWTYGDGYNPNISDPLPHLYPINPPGANDVYTLRLDVTDLSGICSDTDTKTVTVFDEALAEFNPKNSTDCDPYTVTFDNVSQNAVSYKWDFDDGGTTSTAFEPTYEFNNPTSGTKIFNVELEATSDEGCKNTFSSAVNVLPNIEADFDIDISEGCSPLTVTISNNYVGTQCYWYWDKDDRVVDAGVLAAADSTVNFASFTKTYINNSGTSRTDSLTLIVGNGNNCYEIFKRAITVHSTIDAQFSVDVSEGCNPLTVQFTNNTVNGDTYNWLFGDGSSTTLESPSHPFINTTTDDKTFTVRLTAESAEGCVDQMQQDITVYSKVISDFSVATSEGCPPFTTSIDNTSIGNAANTYQWLIDNVAVAGAPNDLSDFEHEYENTAPSVKDYEVKLIATNPHACTSEHTDIVRVYEYVEASFSMSLEEGCTPLDIEFTDLSTVPASTKYTWDFGDGASSGLSNPDHTFYNSSRTTDLTRTIDLTVQSPNYCSDDTSLTVDIYHQPLANFYIDKTSSCPPLESTLSKLSEGEDMFEWRFGDGNTNTTDANLAYSWDNTDIDNIQYYKLELWVGTNHHCKDSMSFDLSVFPKVVADYSMSANSGCNPVTDVQFTNQSTSPATQFFWSFGDGSTTNLENPTHDFANIGMTDKTYDIFFRASSEYNCWDTITKQIDVYVQPDAEFYIDPTLMIFPDNIVSIDNKTNSGPFDYLWEFGNIDESTSTIEEPSQFEYEHWGEKIIELSVTSQTNPDCFDYYVDTVIILPPKVNANFTTNIAGGCLDEGLEVEFTAAGSAFNETYQYDWEFGDGERGSGQYINHTYTEPGVYYVKLTARSTEYTEVEEDFAYKTISVYANPVANFEVSPNFAMLDPSTLEARVKFYNLSVCTDTTCAYTWEFGDGETANSTDVTHGYRELGIFDVTLTAVASNIYECTHSLTKENAVEIIGAGQIAFPNAFTPDGMGPVENETFRPLAEGVIEYELFVYNRWGEMIFTTKDLSQGWNGTIDGEPAKPDVYVWKAQGKYTNGKSFELAGDVTLIR